MPLIISLRNFLLKCPFLAPFDGVPGGDPRIYVDYQTGNPTAYSLSLIPTTPWVRKYTDGGGVKQAVFVFRSIDEYAGRDIVTNMDNIAFFERLEQWLESTRPDVPSWNKVEVLSNGYFFDVAEGEDRASYQIQCRVLYTV